ncbi:ribosomal protein L7/L12 [Streptomyces sp. AC495_CC817]|uniref:ribosomal protein L7/L12 n=1 Tax=Streptomyces sp. AC495_CC817 TaxID=2823900 RepID=UPI0027E08099|nr:ribosomal protein L7/L12 [Streptomyces sp. AC495_CC817]
MDSVILVVVIAAVVVIGIAVIAAALRGMRPKVPEAQVYRPATTTPRTPAASAAPAPSGLTPQVTAQIDGLVAAGQKIQAIKLYRESTGVGLKEAKDRIDHWSISTTAPHPAAVSHASARLSSPSSIRASLPTSVSAEIDRLVAGGQKITAIKLLREHTGFGLKESKDAIEAWPTAR